METYAVYLAYKHPQTPWYAKLFAACVVGYAFSPIDLIPDPIPILGYLDDLVLVPLGMAVALKMIPPSILAECRSEAQVAMSEDRPRSWVAAAVIVVLWLLLAALIVGAIVRVIYR
jgi:uncharacterized membrane protein YkvA (DUF1232 family)